MNAAELNVLTLAGLLLNFVATLGAYVRLRVELEHRLTKLETHVLNGVHKELETAQGS